MGLNNRLDQPEERICKLEHTSFVVFAVRTKKRKKNMKKGEERLNDLRTPLKDQYVHYGRCREEEKKGAK